MAEYRDEMRRFARVTELDAERRRALAERVTRRPARTRAVTLLGATAALAACALLFLRPPDRSSPPPADGPLTEAVALATGALTEEVALDVAGTGTVSRDGKRLALGWEQGTLSVEVEPDRGVQLSVQTHEALVRVVGTGFTVNRDPLGTAVAVRHGRVEVTCHDQPAVFVEAGGEVLCLPATAADRLGRVLTLQQRGAADAVLLAEADDALAITPAERAVRVELESLRIDALIGLGRTEDAWSATLAALSADAGARTADLHRVAARLAAGDCIRAMPHLEWLEAHSLLGEDAPQLAGCR